MGLIIAFLVGTIFGVCVMYNSYVSFQSWLQEKYICESDEARREVYKEVTESIKQRAWKWQ